MADVDELDERERVQQENLRKPVSTRFNPAAVAEAMEDPAVFEQVARGDLYVQLHHLRQLAANPRFPTAQRMEYAKFLAKMGKVEKPEETHNPLAGVPAITIVLPSSGQRTQTMAESSAIDIDEDDWSTGGDY